MDFYGNTHDIEIYYKDGTHVGFEQNAGAWTLLGTANNVAGNPRNSPTSIPIVLSQYICAGNTGASMATAKFVLKPVEGIERPAIATLMPSIHRNNPFVLIDIGANTDCKPLYLLQFALMGDAYARNYLNLDIYFLCREPVEELNGRKISCVSFLGFSNQKSQKVRI